MSELVLGDPKSLVVKINSKEFKVYPTSPKVMQVIFDYNSILGGLEPKDTQAAQEKVINTLLGDNAYNDIFSSRIYTIDDGAAVINHVLIDIIDNNKMFVDAVTSDAIIEDTTEQAA